jgi:NDP-sugar pyrophosphorylase family protein
MGSRFGGLKQLETIGPNGETIMDYSVYDALQAGFGKVVFVIQEHFEEAFRERFVDKWKERIRVEYIFQQLNDLPGDFTVPNNRKKAWGTGHAVWSARALIQEPFAVINADDFYGRDNYQTVAHFFAQHPKANAMVAYPLGATLSAQGSVSRGVCQKDEKGMLISVTEHEQIKEQDGQIHSLLRQEILTADTPVSMNSWALQPSLFDFMEEQFCNFLEAHSTSETKEFYLPSVVQAWIDQKQQEVHVLSNEGSWFGVTYKEDKTEAKNKISALIKAGVYPEKL